MKAEADWQAIAREELRFFSDVSASISHEINNRFAVIFEKAGLLEDLAARLALGKEVDPERFGVQSRKVIEQVRLAKEIVRNLNRFAHSVDIEASTIDVHDVVEFVAGLYARKAAMADAELSVAKPSRPVTMTADPFALQTVVGRGLDIALDHIGAGGTVVITAGAADRGARVIFSGLELGGGEVEMPDATRGVQALLALLGARFSAQPDGGGLVLEIPDHEHRLHGRTA
jgi:signal transduction histidine kinase